MCGIAGFIDSQKADKYRLEAMIQALGHRGPDDTGFFVHENIGLANSRLSIIDIKNGIQPVTNEDKSIVVIFNGEIFNYLDLREELFDNGHRLDNNSDTAVLPHMYEEYGTKMFERLNGQFAIAIWDMRLQQLILARDRFGEKPLYYYYDDNVLVFSSEIKAIFKSGFVYPEISLNALNEVFTYWSTTFDKSVFKGVASVRPGNYLVYFGDEIKEEAYWQLSFTEQLNGNSKSLEGITEELEDVLIRSVKGRLIADVPVSAYLSGGLDSSLVTAIAAKHGNSNIDTFSITFREEHFDESKYQILMAEHLGLKHHSVEYNRKDFPKLIRRCVSHAETPFLRTGPLPMYKLAEFVSKKSRKVVISGEGADEIFGGYDIFREVKIREFCARFPDSAYRNLLYKKVNKFAKQLSNQSSNSLALFYNSSSCKDLFASHVTRWRMGLFCRQLFSKEAKEEIVQLSNEEYIKAFLPQSFNGMTPIQRAQYIEIVTFFSGYLLSTQGDRMSMASGVECRFPFLDNSVVEFALQLPDNLKIKVLKEKYLLKKLAEKYIPKQIINRQKFPYRAPLDIRKLLQDEYIRYLLGNETIKRFNIFDDKVVCKYIDLLNRKGVLNERDVMVFMGILTTQILYDDFIQNSKYIVHMGMRQYL